MFIKVSSRQVINTDHIVEIEIIEALPERVEFDEEERRDVTLPARPTKVEITTDAVDGHYEDGGDYPEHAHHTISPLSIILVGDEADLFLAGLPVYEPLLEAEVQ